MTMYYCYGCGSDYCKHPKIYLNILDKKTGEEIWGDAYKELNCTPAVFTHDEENFSKLYNLYEQKIGEGAIHFCSVNCLLNYLNNLKDKKFTHEGIALFCNDVPGGMILQCNVCEKEFFDKPCKSDFTNTDWQCPYCLSLLKYPENASW